MTYRIHFTAEDLARTRIAEAPMPLSELHLAARALRDRSQPVRLGAWRRRALPRLTSRAWMALSLIPPVGWSPTFLTPAHPGELDDLLDQVRATPTTMIDTELAAIAERQPLPAWTSNLPHDATLRDDLFDGLSDLHAELVAPYWTQAVDCFTADRTLRLRQFLNGGVDHLLARANPQWLRWNPPVLEIRNPVDYDLHLRGQGVLLVPSVFGTRSFVGDDAHAQAQPTVSYPVADDDRLLRLTALTPRPTPPRHTAPVSALLGHTRAAVLNSIAEHPGCSTKELAALIGISPPSASEHATVLRAAGLIHTNRHRNTALHTPTTVGLKLLNASGPPPHRS
ncbi:winged helix-turn-helix domain-containing protein [Yinghuangia seranimata]|uniref:winged helix-turn-helix domain-containing protein n=1 Tax=Yinghuangia seranimata TaxID=408067 RepID=UPI00248A951A|nr:winged helix-turn-helix domain-containing protein [Yinghuangia seranimata]MDI2125042.1 winged helix-turn-helix domain-containing protein [Yinghuangia seranimata]